MIKEYYAIAILKCDNQFLKTTYLPGMMLRPEESPYGIRLVPIGKTEFGFTPLLYTDKAVAERHIKQYGAAFTTYEIIPLTVFPSFREYCDQ